MLNRQGFTIVEITVVIIIIGVAAALVLPNLTTPAEQSKASNAQHNLLAIYSAQQNYRNNNGTFASIATLALINTSLSLNIPDDGSYLYSCSNADPSGFSCTASRNSAANLVLIVKNAPIQLTGNINPTCTSSTGNSNWCP